jgi:hypothetical protein
MRKLINFIKNMFNYKRKSKSSETADLSKGFHPEILFLINRPYAEYVDYKEI